MRSIQKIVVLAAFLFPAVLFAQNHMQDVIYLKDGSIYKGIIIEQVPNVSYKIQSKDGNVFAVQLSEVEKITKEDKPQHYEHRGHYGWGYHRNDSIKYEPKKRGYFLEGQVLIENVQGGVRLVNGYKFGSKGYLGVGIGMDHVFSNPFNPRVNGLEKKALAGTYSLLYLYYAADGPTRGRFTPYLAVEAGYALAMKGWGDNDNRVDDFGNTIKGGPMAGFEMGFKVQSRRKPVHMSLLFNVNYKQVNYETNQLFISNSGQVTGFVQTEEVGHLIIPGIRLGFGF